MQLPLLFCVSNFSRLAQMEAPMVYGPPAGFVRNKPSVYIDRDYCTGCMKCVRLCPQKHVLEPARDEHGPYSHVADHMLCAGCGLCLQNCPTHAVRIKLTLRE